MNPLEELLNSSHPLVTALASGASQHPGWDNKPSWDNWTKAPAPWNNQPSWDNWTKK
jgi:hypothetical protein